MITLFIPVLFFALSSSQEQCASRNEFLCNSLDCIRKEFICDGTRNCQDGSDETTNLCKHRDCSVDSVINFDKGVIIASSTQKFRCSYGACISEKYICDGERNCADGSDETSELCRNRKCKSSEFKCAIGGCIFNNLRCNGRDDCLDGSDEGETVCSSNTVVVASNSNGLGCRLSVGEGTKIQIIQCGEEGQCVQDGQQLLHLPSGTVFIVICNTDSAREPFICVEDTLWNPFNKATTLPGSQICSNAHFVRLVDEIKRPVPLTTSPAPSTTRATSVQVPSRDGCSQTVGKEDAIEIISCGKTSECDDGNLPRETIVRASCTGVQQEAVICKNDNLWHPYFRSKEAPRRYLCTPESGVVITAGRQPSPDCGDSSSTLIKFPWLVGLFRDGSYACTGVLIRPSLILTAGHCVVRNQASRSVINEDQLSIQHYSGVQIQEKSTVSAIILHPDYRGGASPRQDIALVRLWRSLSHIPSVCLDSEGKLAGKLAKTFDRAEGRITYNWDLLDQMMDTSCFNKVTPCSKHLDIGSDQFCGMNTDHFQTDGGQATRPSKTKYLHRGSSGGPYLISIEESDRWAVAGIMSYAVESLQCEKPHFVFTSVSKNYDWITNCGFNFNC